MSKESVQYSQYDHSIGIAAVHFVWCPKRGKDVLTGEIRDRLYELWQKLANEKEWKIRWIEIYPDYVHLLVEISPRDPIHLVAKTFKARSSNYLRKEFDEIKKMPCLWNRSYFFSTAADVSTATIQKYVQDPKHW